MGKEGKLMGVARPADVRRTDAPEPRHTKAKTKQKVYPPHWKVSINCFGYFLAPYHGSVNHADFYRADARPDMRDLVAYLGWWAERCPKTKDWAVRFVNGQPVECGREVIPN